MAVELDPGVEDVVRLTSAARHRRAAQAVHEREEELVAGHAELSFGAIVTSPQPTTTPSTAPAPTPPKSPLESASNSDPSTDDTTKPSSPASPAHEP